MCPKCEGVLAPIIYGNWSNEMIPLHRDKKVILADTIDRYLSTPASHCFNCNTSSHVVVQIPNFN